MFSDLLSWQTLVAGCIAILGLLGSAFVYEHIKNPNIIWLGVIAIIGLEIYCANSVVQSLKQRNSELIKSPDTDGPKTHLDSPPSQTVNPATSTSTPQAGATKTSDGRTIVKIAPQYLCSFFKDHLEIQAGRLIAPYIGKWMEISGTLKNARETPFFLSVDLHEEATLGVCLNLIFDLKWREEIEILKNGDSVTIRGQITGARPYSVTLEKCELI